MPPLEVGRPEHGAPAHALLLGVPGNAEAVDEGPDRGPSRLHALRFEAAAAHRLDDRARRRIPERRGDLRRQDRPGPPLALEEVPGRGAPASADGIGDQAAPIAIGHPLGPDDAHGLVGDGHPAMVGVGRVVDRRPGSDVASLPVDAPFRFPGEHVVGLGGSMRVVGIERSGTEHQMPEREAGLPVDGAVAQHPIDPIDLRRKRLHGIGPVVPERTPDLDPGRITGAGVLDRPFGPGTGPGREDEDDEKHTKRSDEHDPILAIPGRNANGDRPPGRSPSHSKPNRLAPQKRPPWKEPSAPDAPERSRYRKATPNGALSARRAPTRGASRGAQRRPRRGAQRRLGLVGLDQDVARLRPHDARIRALAVLEHLADLRARDREGLLVRVALGQIDAAEALVERREADLARLDRELTGQVVEDLVRIEVAPDRLPVLEGRIRVLAADHDVGEAVVLAVDAVHDRFGGATVEHLDVETDQLEDVRDVVAGLLPDRRILVALTEHPLAVELAVAEHPGRGRDVVALELAHQGVEHGAREVAGGSQLLDAVDQRVLVGAVERVAGLEREGALPLLLGDERAAHLRREHELAVGLVGALRERLELSADQLRAVVVVDDPAAGMIDPLRAVDALQVARLVPVEDLEIRDDRDGLARFGLDGASAARGEATRFGVGQGERDRDRPGVSRAVRLHDLLVEGQLVSRLLHRPRERRQRAVRDPVDRGQIRIGHPDLGQA